QELRRRHPRIEDKRDLRVLRGLRQQRAHDRGLAGADLACELHKAARLVDAVQEVSQSFGVSLAQIQITRIGSDRERLFVDADERQIHGAMLLDRVTTPQRAAAEARPGLIQSRIEAGCVRWRGFEQAELARRAQVSQDYSQKAKFRTRMRR